MLFPERHDNTAEAIEIINTFQVCQSFHVLPGPGGLLQQDWMTPVLMEVFLDAQAQKAELEEKKTAAGLENRTHAPRFA